MKINTDKNNEINFQAIKMKPKDMQSSCELLRSYASTDRKEFGQKAFEIFDKYISKEAKNVSEKRGLDFVTVYDYLCNLFWKNLDDLKFKCSRAENYFKKLCFELKYDVPVVKKPTIKKPIQPQNTTDTEGKTEEPQKFDKESKSTLEKKSVQESLEKTEINSPEQIHFNDKKELFKNISEKDKPEITQIDNIKTKTELPASDRMNQDSKYRKRAAEISLENKNGTSYRQIARNEDISLAAVRRAALIHRNTMKLVNGEIPNEIRERAQEFISVFGLSSPISEVIKWLISNPALITADIKNLEEHIHALSKNLNIDKTKLAVTGIKAVAIYTAKPETMINNIDTTLKIIKDSYGVNIDRNNYVKTCLAQPQVFAYKPETILNKIQTVEKYLLDKNIKPDKEDYINTWVRSLWLLSNSVERTTAKLDKFYLDNTLVNWQMIKNLFEELVYMDKEQISNNINEVIKEFEPFGLTRENYEDAIRKQKPLAKQNPQTVIKKVKSLSEIFTQHGLTLNDCLRVCVKQPSLFYQSPDTIKEHLNAYLYVYKNKYNQTGKEAMQNVLSNCLSYSNLKIYLEGIIYPLLKNNIAELKSLKLVKLQQNVVEFFKNNPDFNCTIEIVDGDMKEHFIRTMDDFCKQYIGRNVFSYKMIPPKETIHKIKTGTRSALKSNQPEKPQIQNINTTTEKTIPQKPAEISEEYAYAPNIIVKSKTSDLKMLIKDEKLPIQFENKLMSFIELFNWKGSLSELRKAFLKHTELFSMKLSVLVHNVNLFAKNIELDDKNLLTECILKNPMPFYHSPQKLENNIKELLVEFKKYGLTKEKLFKLYASKGSLISSNKTLAKNLRANIYSSKYNKETSLDIDTILDKSITMPEADVYINKIIIPQISDEIYLNSKLTSGNFAEFMKDFLRSHPLKKFTIKVLKDYMADNFIEVMNEYSLKHFGHEIFNYIECSKIN